MLLAGSTRNPMTCCAMIFQKIYESSSYSWICLWTRWRKL